MMQSSSWELEGEGENLLALQTSSEENRMETELGPLRREDRPRDFLKKFGSTDRR